MFIGAWTAGKALILRASGRLLQSLCSPQFSIVPSCLQWALHDIPEITSSGVCVFVELEGR